MPVSRIDWEAAFAYYASLPPGRRSYQAVADQFSVSVRTVETHGRNAGWKTRLREIDAETAERTRDQLISARVEQVQTLQRLIEASFVAYAQRLRAGEVRMSAGDLEKLNRLSTALLDEITHPARPHPVDPESGRQSRSAEHSQAVLEALAEAGALEALGLTRLPAGPGSDGQDAP